MRRLKPNHLALIDMLADPADRRTMIEKSAAAGFADRYVWELLKDADFLKALHSRTTELVAACRARVYSNLLAASDGGDTKAGEVILKACGDITGGTNVTTNITQTNANNEDFADRLRDNYDSRRLAHDREKVIRPDGE